MDGKNTARRRKTLQDSSSRSMGICLSRRRAKDSPARRQTEKSKKRQSAFDASSHKQPKSTQFTRAEEGDIEEGITIEQSKQGSNRCNFSSELRTSLSDILDSDYGLLEKLSCVLTERQYQSLRQLNGYDRNDKLMEIVNLLPQDEFLKALHETGQQHIVNFIKHKSSNKAEDFIETCLPLTEKQRNILRSNRYQLANLIDVESLLPMLYSSNCMTEVHLNYIKTERISMYDHNLCLLTILLKRSQADYFSFIDALIESGQGHLASIFSQGGGACLCSGDVVLVASIRAVLAESDLEEEVVVRFSRRWWNKATPEKRQQLFDLLGTDAELVDVQKSSSVALYILYKTLSAFKHFDTILKDGTLKSVLGRIFSTILDERHVEINELDFYESSYISCLNYFHQSLDFNRDSIACDQHEVADVKERRMRSPSVADLLLEVLEIVLVKGVVLIFKHLMKLSIDADSLAITTVLMVCQRWRHVVETRPFIVHQIKETLAHGTKSVYGVSTLDNKLFIVSEDSSTVCVFDLTSFSQLQNIELKGLLKYPYDIATCEVTRRIYIADFDNKCVWRIDWSSSTPSSTSTVTDDSTLVVKFIDCEEYRPLMLSTSGRRQQLLATGDYGNSLYVYDVDGKLLRRVELATEVDDGVEWNYTQHAVQATIGDNYFVCRSGKYHHQRVYSHAEVVEYSSTGQRLRSYYGGPRGDGPQVDYPWYVALIGDGRLLFADKYSQRVSLLNTDLKLERVLLTRQLDSQPVKLCYNSQTGLLCVAMSNGRVNVYKIC